MTKRTRSAARKRSVPVTQRALLARINRKLESDAREGGDRFVLFTLRGAAADEFGKFILVPAPSLADQIGHGRQGPLTHNRIERDNVDLEAYGREVGVLRTWESLAR
jgi:hypothetical protein